METKQLDVLLRACKGDVNTLAFVHIFNQDALTEDDHAFLEERISSLDADILVAWLTRGAPRPRPIVDRLVEVWPAEATGLVMLHLAPRARWADPEGYDDLLDRLHGRLDLKLWGHLAKALRGMCSTFEKAAGTEYAFELVAALFPHRRDEQACRKTILRLARDGGAIVYGPTWSLNRSDGVARSPLRDRASVIAWMETHHLLEEHTVGEVLPDGVSFLCEGEHVEPEGAEDYLFRLALRWPGKEPAGGREWYVRQVLDASRRKVDWGALLYEVVGSRRTGLGRHGAKPHVTGEDAIRIVDEVARRSFGTDVEAPWIGYSICRALNRRDPDAWERAFRYLGRSDLHFSMDRCLKTSSWIWPITELHGDREDMEGNPWVEEIPLWILFHAPLPEAADDSFDERLLSFRGLVQPDVPLGSLPWIARLAKLPVTRTRANRLLAMAIAEEGSLTRINVDVLSTIADAADPLPPDTLPGPEDFFVRSEVDQARLSIYRKLAGARADELLRVWIRAPLDDPEDSLGEGSWNAAARMRAIPELAPAGLAEEILQRMSLQPLAEVLHFQQFFPELLHDEIVDRIAAERVGNLEELWADRHTVKVPERLAALAFQRCRGPISSYELVPLCTWLLDLGWDPKAILSCILDRSPRLEWDWQVQELVHRILNNRSRWETLGPAVVGAMLADGAGGALWSLVERSTSSQNGEVQQGLVVAVHEAFAVVLLKRAAAALAEGEESRAVPPLHALVALHPPARLSTKLLPMLRAAPPGSEVRDLVELNMGLLKRSKTRDAQPADVLGALQLMRDQARPD